ncbi:36750_t:CDS:1, partial [Racocetra persica]
FSKQLPEVSNNNSQINTIINELLIINKKVSLLINGSNNVGNQINHLKAIKINPKELNKLLYEEIKLCTEKSIVRKLYQGNNVACKSTNIVNGISLNQRIQAQLVILEKLKEYPNILKFYGLSNLDDNQVMVFE